MGVSVGRSGLFVHRRWMLTGVLAAVVCSMAAMEAKADSAGWKTTADAGEIGLVGLALGKTVAERDWQGGEQLGLGLGVTAGVSEGLKSIVREPRPDRSDDRSFPSGHTSISFAAAGYLQKRYGWEWGLPATVAASVVGLARVESRSHHWYDVLAGAAIGEGSAYFLTTPRNSRVRWLPWADSRGAGVYVHAEF